MMRQALAISFALAAGSACGGAEPTPPSAHDPRYVQGFDPPAEAAGYTRFVLPPIAAIQPGQEAIWCQWLTPAMDEDMDILDVGGFQSAGGHHAVFYATSALAPVGTTRPCTDEDLTSVRFLGGVGGEAGTTDNTKLPPGVVYRIPKGVALMANAHYVNASERAIDGQAVLDLRLDRADPSRVVASMFTNLDVNHVVIPAGEQKTVDTYCDVQEDLQIFWFGNHMHALGVSAFTELTRADGSTEMVAVDRVWKKEATFNPTFTRWPIDQPLLFRRGDRLHTQCSWNNTTGQDVYFPTEMCVGVGFYIGSGVQVLCIEGSWGH